MHHKISEKYNILKELGRGAYGIVYLAKHKQLEEFKAIKELTPKTKLEKARVKREVEILQKAQHPHLIKIDEIFSYKESTYICMEYAQGGSLEQKLPHYISTQESLEITIDILKGVQALHAKGIIHRDLKPANILFDHTGKAKIGDFGIAKTSLNISKQLTQTGATLGTIGYMPPEQLLGKKNEIDEQVDIYATGIILYELLVSQHPFKGSNQLETVNRSLQEKYTIRLEDCNLDQELTTICYKAINKNKSKRYQYASQMLEHLMTYSIKNTSTKTPITKNPSFKIIEVGVLGLLGGITISGILSTIFSETRMIKKQWEKQIKNYQDLSKSYQKKKESSFKLRQKEIQRTIYNEIQRQSKTNITEKILQGKELYKIGMIYYEGKGIERNYQKAYEYFEKAIEYESLDAKLQLGKMYQEGKGVKKNQHKALKYYTEIGEKGDARGYYQVGFMLLKERNVHQSRDYFKQAASMNHEKSIDALVGLYGVLNKRKEVAEYLQKGAKLNSPYCLRQLGISLLLGEYGFRVDKEQGIKYLGRAMLYGEIKAVTFLANNTIIEKEKKEKMLKDIFLITEKKMDDDDKYLAFMGHLYLYGIGTNIDYKKAKKLCEKASKSENADAINNLGVIYYNGYGVKINHWKAKYLFEQAVALENTNAMINLASMYEQGHGGEKDYLEARMLYQRSMISSDSEGIYKLGIMYERGLTVAQSYSMAKVYYEKATQLGNSSAMVYLGKLYQEGHGVDKSYSKAKELFEEAVELGDTNAITNLGMMYYNGHGIKKDYAKAKELFENAAKLGDTNAMYNLGVIYYNGNGTQQDHIKAKKLFKQAASMGHQNAINTLKTIK